MTIRHVLKITAASMLCAALIGCTNATPQDENDPMESLNRGVFEFNQFVDSILLRPVAKGYRYITPQGIRTRVGNVSDNIREPLNLINALLQGDVTQALTTFWRFAINTTIGIGGMHDVAGDAGLKERREDFGQTLGTYGVGTGAYIVLPIFGPSNGRDVIGRVADWFLDPFHYYLETDDQIWIALGQGLVERERLIDPIDDINETSLDPYISFRSMYTQHRAASVANTTNGGYGFDYEEPKE